ncbi:hypothetical protein CCM_05403 [Cordyceps militaris CM01]|uniref:Uncharacterized protein n=1 Tax=Cordyceps militaris (strain CM01) TaxID=983644 RepID=G3JJF1_CORMM|nr:uncharacterized protein CCM_05403 [Cordyceps militaris CM01]EGX91245.1 hypothetical protein CCM_05403 [Cordyceps militaris CM01]
MKSLTLALAAIMVSPIFAAPIGPSGPCPDVSCSGPTCPSHAQNTNKSFVVQYKVDAILNGQLDPSACCSYGTCKGDVVISVGE